MPTLTKWSSIQTWTSSRSACGCLFTINWGWLSKFAQQKKATPAQLALAWLLAKKAWIVPIPGTTKLHRLEENLGAANVGLTAEDLRAIESASSNIKVEGAWYPQWVEQTIGR